MERLRSALERLWTEDEMGWINTSVYIECGKCGATVSGNNHALIIHNEGCIQGYISDALDNAMQRKEGGE
jgi:hypothetical protein